MTQRPASINPPALPRLFAAQRPSIIVGASALLICAIAGIFDPFHALRAYLFAWLACVGIALGALSLIMLHCLTGGRWGWALRRPAEAATLTLPLLLVLFIPLAIGLKQIYPWADSAQVHTQIIVQHRQTLFAPWKVLMRTVLFFAIWIFWARRLCALSLAQEQSGNPLIALQLRRLSAIGFVVYFITMSLAAMDWIASREVDWYSSTFGLLVIIGQAVIATAFLIVILALLSDAPVLRSIAMPETLNDLGNLLLTMVVLWSYVEFAQFLVIWMGNSQEDNLWYYHRSHRGWGIVGTALILIHFAIPFVLLLFQNVKRYLPKLAAVAGVVLVMRIVHVLWMVAPSSSQSIPRAVHWLDLIAPFGVGGIWFGLFVWILKQRPLVAARQASAVKPKSTDETGQSQIRPVA
jgi:hypothetical protein